jgi:hypothetical protein
VVYRPSVLVQCEPETVPELQQAKEQGEVESVIAYFKSDFRLSEGKRSAADGSRG